jgi:uncharacterized protein YxeA
MKSLKLSKIAAIVISIFLISGFTLGKHIVNSENILLKNSNAKKQFEEVTFQKLNDLYKSLSPRQLEKTKYAYTDKERLNFKRFPGNRNGVSLPELSDTQLFLLHDILNDVFSANGYLKMFGVISNEDAPARMDELLGRDKYWITFFDKPSNDKNWGFRFEGDHMSINLAFKGKQIISHNTLCCRSIPFDYERQQICTVHKG